jgi:hypothetical protein
MRICRRNGKSSKGILARRIPTYRSRSVPYICVARYYGKLTFFHSHPEPLLRITKRLCIMSIIPKSTKLR